MRKFRTNVPVFIKIMRRRILNCICKVGALIAAAAILPVLAHAQTTTTVPPTAVPPHATVPEGGPGIVLLITTVGAILLVSARMSSRKKA